MNSRIGPLGAGPLRHRGAERGGGGAAVMAAAAAAVASPADKERYRGHGLFVVGSFVGSFVYMSLWAKKKTRAEQGVVV